MVFFLQDVLFPVQHSQSRQDTQDIMVVTEDLMSFSMILWRYVHMRRNWLFEVMRFLQGDEDRDDETNVQ